MFLKLSKRQCERNNQTKIVVIIRNYLGDFIAMAVPLCNHLQSVYGKCDFYFFYPDRDIKNKEIIKYFFPDAHIFPTPSGNRYFQRFKMAIKYRWIKPDIGISTVFNYPKTNSLFLLTIGARERYARVTNKFTSKLLNHPFIFADINELHNQPIGLCSLQIFNHNIMEIPQASYPLFDTNKIKSYNPKYSGLKILVEVSNSKHFCQLSNTKCAEILNELYKKRKFSILISAKSLDYAKAADLQSKLFMDAEIHVSTTLDDFISFVNASDIVLTGDGGLGHISGALNKRIVALYSRTPVQHWGIITRDVIHLYDPDDINNINNEIITTAISNYL